MKFNITIGEAEETEINKILVLRTLFLRIKLRNIFKDWNLVVDFPKVSMRVSTLRSLISSCRQRTGGKGETQDGCGSFHDGPPKCKNNSRDLILWL